MKTLLGASAILLLCAMPGAYAQDTGPKNDSSIHQSAGDRDSRGTPKHYQPSHARYYGHRHHYGYSHRGASGVRYSHTIHQSAGDRDSRGNPK